MSTFSDSPDDMPSEFPHKPTPSKKLIKLVDSVHESIARTSLISTKNSLPLPVKKSIKPMPLRTLAQSFQPWVWQQTQRQGHAVHLQIDIHPGLTVPAHWIQPLQTMMNQALQNALTHGFETPETRLAQGKSLAAQICIQAERDGHELVLCVRDDGRGLSKRPTRLLETAHLATSASFEKADYLESASEIRLGIGLHLVQTQLKPLQGQLSLIRQNGWTIAETRVPFIS